MALIANTIVRVATSQQQQKKALIEAGMKQSTAGIVAQRQSIAVLEQEALKRNKEDQIPRLIVDGKIKKISRKSRYLLDMLTIEEDN